MPQDRDPASTNPADSHYLRDELYELVRQDPSIFDFLQNGSLDEEARLHD